MNNKISKIGVIGGLGPMASASFIETIYSSYIKKNHSEKYNYPPYVYLYSEPLLTQCTPVMSIRTSEEELVGKLEKNISHLMKLEVDFIVICCFTAHALLPKLNPLYLGKVFSLVTRVLEHVIEQSGSFVFLSSSSAKESCVLEDHPLWVKAKEQIKFVTIEEQGSLNSLIKAVKENQINLHVLDDFKSILKHYAGYQFIIACAELHILHKHLQISSGVYAEIFDPFFQITQKIIGEAA